MIRTRRRARRPYSEETPFFSSIRLLAEQARGGGLLRRRRRAAARNRIVALDAATTPSPRQGRTAVALVAATYRR